MDGKQRKKVTLCSDSQEKFGKEIEITDKEKKIGTKRLSEYGSDVDTDDLAEDSDLDVSTRELALMESRDWDKTENCQAL